MLEQTNGDNACKKIYQKWEVCICIGDVSNAMVPAPTRHKMMLNLIS
jgi:hypothetical protein